MGKRREHTIIHFPPPIVFLFCTADPVYATALYNFWRKSCSRYKEKSSLQFKILSVFRCKNVVLLSGTDRWVKGRASSFSMALFICFLVLFCWWTIFFLFEDGLYPCSLSNLSSWEHRGFRMMVTLKLLYILFPFVAVMYRYGSNIMTLIWNLRSSAGKESTCNAGDPNSIPGSEHSLGEGIGYPLQGSWASLLAQMVKNPPTMRETWVWSLDWDDHLEKGMATHSSIFAWKIPMDRGSWRATVHKVAKGQIWLND